MARMTFYHKELLVNFIEMNRSMVRGKGRGELADVESVRRLWDEVAEKLSSAGAVKRSGEEWKKAWGELLCRTNKMARLCSRGVGAHKKLTPLDHRIIAAGSGNLLLEVNGHENGKRRRPQCGAVKTELVFAEELAATDDDDKPLLAHDRSAHERNSEDRLLDVTSPVPSSPTTSPAPEKTNSTSAGVADSSEVYPRWLVEVERSRARSEAVRARAALRRADAAGEMAAAARLQAEALARLAAAAALQAEAVARVAQALCDKFS